MKHILFFLAVFLIFLAVFLDQSSIGWALEQRFVAFLSTKTQRHLPEVTAVVLPVVDGLLVPQDVALTLRAAGSFHPKKIVVAEPMGDLTNGPLSLIREGVETGYVQGVPFSYCQNEPKESATPSSSVPPLLFAASLKKKLISVLKKERDFFSVATTAPSQLSLDDFLLKREEMERGAIRPDLDIFFRNKTVLISGPQAFCQASELQSLQEEQAMRHIGFFLYGAMVFFFVIGAFTIASYATIDLALLLFFFLLFYAVGIFFLFRSTGLLLPLFLPLAVVLISTLKKIILACANRGEK